LNSSTGGFCQGEVFCGPGNCDGCCTPDGQCSSGFDRTACGIKGQTCQRCPAGYDCPIGTGACQPLKKCDFTNCAGCCLGDECIEPTTRDPCGIKGEACKACGSTQVCSAEGACVNAPTGCNPDTCGGCCIGNFCATGNDQTACGLKG